MLCFLLGFTITLITIPPLIRIAYKFNIMDRPEGRKAHGRATPILGGIGIYIGWILAYLVSGVNVAIEPSIIYGATVMLLLGLLDDIWDIRALYKLFIQIICASLVILSGLGLNFGLGLLDIVLSIVWIVGITNAINLMDGLDGLAGGVATIASFIFGLIAYLAGNMSVFYLSLSLIGVSLAFLFYNFYPAQTFMGDGGSLFLGFMLSLISMMVVNGSEGFQFVTVPVLVLGIPIYETGSSIIRRVMAGRSVMSADREHIHYRLLNRGMSHRNVVVFIYTLSAIAGIFGFIVSRGKLYILSLYIMGIFIVMGFVSGFRLYKITKDQTVGGNVRLLVGITLSEMGGAQKVVYDIISSLPLDRYDITLVTYPGGELIDWLAPYEIDVITIPEIRREISPYNDIVTFFKLYFIMKSGNFHIAHFHSSKMGILGRCAAWVAGVPKNYFTVHGWGINEYQPLWLQRVLGSAEWLAGKMCTKCIFVSEHHKRIGIEKGWIDENKASVIYNGIDDKPDIVGRLREELGVDKKIPIIGTIMRLREPKQPAFTIQVYDELIKRGLRAELVIIGDGPQREECIELIAELGIERGVHLLGTRGDARILLNDFDIFTLFSRWEGLPISIIEAMFAGKPIVSSSVGGIPELLIHEETGYLIESFDIKEVADYIQTLLEDDELRISMGKKAFKTAISLFGKEEMSKAYERLYMEG